MSDQLISVILPVYNAEDYLAKAIQSILAQTYQNFELILINDGSTDKSKAICEEYATKDSRILFVENEQNLGVVKTLKKGIEQAKGEYIARMDADDLSHQDRFQVQLDFLENNPTVQIIGTAVGHLNENGEVQKKIPKSYFESNTLRLSSYLTQPFFHGSIMARKELFSQYNYGEDSKAEDFELWLRMNSEGIHLANLNKVLYYHRLNPDGVSAQNEEEQKSHHNQISQQYLELLFNRPLEKLTVEILNNRPLSKVAYLDLKKALELLKELISSLDLKLTDELKSYIRRQQIDIVIQAIKKANSSIEKMKMQFLLLRISLNGKGLTYLFEKLSSQ